MNSESQVLKKIWENKGGSYIKLISSQTGFGIDYTRYLCNCLSKRGRIKAVKGKRDWYRITPRGKKELESRHLIRPKVLKKVKDTEKVTYYFPKKISARGGSALGGKTKTSESNREYSGQKINIKIKKPKSNLSAHLAVLPAKRISKAGLIEAEEKKLNLGQSIMKAVSFLKRSMTQEG